MRFAILRKLSFLGALLPNKLSLFLMVDVTMYAIDLSFPAEASCSFDCSDVVHNNLTIYPLIENY